MWFGVGLELVWSWFGFILIIYQNATASPKTKTPQKPQTVPMMWDGTPWDGKVWDGRTKERSQVIDHIKQDYKTLARLGMEDFKRDIDGLLHVGKVAI
jgi:hypothetical protein